MNILSTSERKREFLLFFLFAVAICFVNMHYVDLMKGTAASEWMTAIGILESPEDYPNSLQYDFFSGINTFSEHTGLWLHQRLNISVTTLDKSQVLLTDFFIVFGTWLLCISLGRGALTATIAILLIFASCFTWLGRYLNLQITYIPTHSAVAFAFGLFILGLFANGKRALPLLLSSLLFVWHPSHSAVIHSFMWLYLVVNFKREGGFAVLVKYAALNFLFLIPAVYATLPQFSSLASPMSDSSVALWWNLLEARTTNIFPLNDGLLAIANVWMSLVAGYFILFIGTVARRNQNSSYIENGTRFSVVVLIWIAFLWCLQIAASHFLHIMPVTRLALTRCTPYAVVYVCIFAAAAVEDLWNRRDRWAVVFPFVAVFLGFLIRLQAPLLVAFMACYAARFIEGRMARYYRLAGVLCFLLLVSSGVLFNALDTFELFSGGLHVILRQICAALLFASIILSVAILAVSAFTLLFRRGSIKIVCAQSLIVSSKRVVVVAVALITIAALMTDYFMLSSGAKFDMRLIEFPLQTNAEARLKLQEWAATSTPRGAMFVLNPLLFAGFEQTAHRPGFVSKEELPYPLYAIGLLDEVIFRLKIMGVDPSKKEYEVKCNLIQSLKEPRCRQNLFLKDIDANYPQAVIANTSTLLSKYSNARYLVVEKEKTVPSNFSNAHPIVYKNELFKVYDLRP